MHYSHQLKCGQDRLLGRGLHAVYITVSKLCSHIGHADALRLQRASLRRGPSCSTYGTVTLGDCDGLHHQPPQVLRPHHRMAENTLRTAPPSSLRAVPSPLLPRAPIVAPERGLVGNPMAIAAAFSGCRFLLALLPRHSSTHFGGPAIAAH